MKKICITVLLGLSSVSAFAASTTPAFDTFINNVSSDVITLNNAQATQANSYAEYNRQLVYTAKSNGSVRGVDAFLKAYQKDVFPHIATANKTIAGIKAGTSPSDVNKSIKAAQNEINQYQTKRTQLFANSNINSGGYYIVNREANMYLCTLQNSQVEKTGKSRFLKFIADTAKVASCATAHELDPSKDLDQKANIYAASITAPAKVSNIILANAEYFSGEQFAERVTNFVATQKTDTKKVIDTNISPAACNAKLENFRDAFSAASQNNSGLKAILSVSQPNSLPRDYIDVLGLDKNNLIGDGLNIAYVSLTGKTLKNANKDYDVCDYNLYKSNKANNVYLSKLVDFDAISKKVNGVLTPAQVYQLFIMSSASASGYAMADKTSGATVLFNK